MRNTKTRTRTLIIFLIAAGYYFYDSLLGTTPSVMIPEIMRHFHVSALGIGILAAAYVYAYLPMQVPGGLIADKLGPRLLVFGSMLLCSAATLGFAAGNNFYLLVTLRFLMGLGGASSTVGAFMIIATWFSPKQFAFLIGIIQFFSAVGNITTDIPVAYSVGRIGWRYTMIWVSLIGFAITIAAWFFLKNKEHQAHYYASHESIWGKLWKVLTLPKTWLVGGYVCFLCIPIMIFAVLWGIPYLAERYHTTTVVASSAIAFMWLGVGVGSPLIGIWSERIGRRVFPLAVTPLIGLVTVLIILFVSDIPYSMMCILLFCFGLSGAGQTLSFALVREYNPSSIAGTAMGFNNFAVMVGGSIMVPIVGWFLKTTWDGKILHGIPVYKITAYEHAFYLLPIFYIISFIISAFFLEETFCKLRGQT